MSLRSQAIAACRTYALYRDSSMQDAREAKKALFVHQQYGLHAQAATARKRLLLAVQFARQWNRKLVWVALHECAPPPHLNIDRALRFVTHVD